MLTGSGNRPEYDTVAAWIERHGANSLLSRNAEAEALFRQVGVTFAVYGEGGDPERLIPFDLIPRVFSTREWDIVERGSIQRAQALNAFLADVYGEQEIIKAGKIPAEVVHDNPAYNKALHGIRRRATSTLISWGWTWCGPVRISSTSLKTMRARHRASLTFLRPEK